MPARRCFACWYICASRVSA
ncbi:rCG24849 [Rattus norvegicus]|uniref:RCG24849 n=1 Tax=Rattus norvegicus TaxID=10116 RepID=A6JC57_RAT|nr:rCG24849 [Rattus norvegicus]